MPTPQEATRMRSGTASDTAHLTARVRAADAVVEPSRRLLDDRFAALFVTEPPPPATSDEALRRLGAIDHAHGGFLAEILLRQRFFEHELVRSVADGVRQVVMLGAGYDTTALRMPGYDGLRYFEVDHPATQRAKLATLAQEMLSTPSVTYVPHDFEAGGSLVGALAEAGFDPAQPCIVGWLGVTFFLQPGALHQALAELAEICTAGSVLVFDYMDESVIDGTTPYRGALEMARKVGAEGEPYLTGLTPQSAAEAVRRAGFWPMEELRVPDLVKRFGGNDPYCNGDDFMGVMAAERAGNGGAA
ncbi:class I SAM-dependent methyltransferase [Streptomyces sp. NPDC087901]|uniref:class I SAM-dependent methyltransferase n=1 Tax=unclassified Streptomyces TaxID=2593676 RepID=UPI003415EF7A